jgi:hypothetical protein
MSHCRAHREPADVQGRASIARVPTITVEKKSQDIPVAAELAAIWNRPEMAETASEDGPHVDQHARLHIQEPSTDEDRYSVMNAKM